MTAHRPSPTLVRVAPTRLPDHVRPRLARLARRGAEVCSKAGARLLTEISMALEIALLDLAGAELRATNAETRARRAERELGQARATIIDLQQDLATRVHSEFQEPTAARSDPDLLARCRAGGPR